MIDPTSQPTRRIGRKNRTSKQELASFMKRVDELFAKEARCPACKKAARLNKGTTEAPVCQEHRRLRFDLAFSDMRR